MIEMENVKLAKLSIFQAHLELFLDQRRKKMSELFKLGPNEFGASGAGRCMRSLYYDKFSDRDIKMATQKIFLIGEMFHTYIQDNILVGGRKEVEVLIEVDGIKIRCHVDYVDEAVVWELKTSSNLSYVSQEPIEKHVRQINLYLGALNRGLGKIVYLDKRYLSIVEHDVVFSQELYDDTVKKLARLYKVYLKHKELPERLERYPRELECKRCWHKALCKNNENHF
jgi:hypothetical protein